MFHTINATRRILFEVDIMGIFFWFTSMKPSFFQAATLKKNQAEATLKMYQTAPYKNQGTAAL